MNTATHTSPSNEAAISLNRALSEAGSGLLELLSTRGREAYFPARGILGQSAEAKGKAINATIGTAFEEDGTPLCLECLEDAIDLPDQTFLYAPSQGVPALRERWREMLLEKNPTLQGKSFSLPIVTHALTHGLHVAGHLLLDPGDALLVTDLYWDNYSLVFEQTWGGRLETFSTFAGTGFDVAAMEAKLMAPGNRKLLLLNFPNNPTGYSPTQAEALAIRDAIGRAAEAGKQIAVIVDDAYFGLVYESGIFEESLFGYLANLHDHVLAIKLDGPTKEDYVWGFRVGFITFGSRGATPEAYRALEAKAAGVVRGSISNASNISQHFLLKAFAHSDYPAQKQTKKAVLQARYQRIRELLEAHPEFAETFEPLPFNAGYFMCVRVRGADPEAVRKRLLEAHDTGVIVASGVIRLAFSAVPLAHLERLFTALDTAIREVRATKT